MKTLKHKLCDCVLLLCLLFCLVFQTMTARSTEIAKESVPVEPVSIKAAAMPLELDENQIAIERHVIGISTTKQEYLEEIMESSNDVPPEEVKPVDWHQKFMEMVRKFDGMGIYNFGSKASVSDFENANKYINGEITSDAFSLKLDCSGFVQLIYWLWTGSYDESLASTYMISRNCESIEIDELKPGDLGLIFADGTYYETPDGNMFYEYDSVKRWLSEDETRTIGSVQSHINHVGIYLGCDENGNMLWAHCNAKTGNITINNFTGFSCFYRVPERDLEISSEVDL